MKFLFFGILMVSLYSCTLFKTGPYRGTKFKVTCRDQLVIKSRHINNQSQLKTYLEDLELKCVDPSTTLRKLLMDEFPQIHRSKIKHVHIYRPHSKKVKSLLDQKLIQQKSSSCMLSKIYRIKGRWVVILLDNNCSL